MRLARALHVPEAEVYVPVVFHRVERESSRMRLRPDRADPLRPERDLFRIEPEKLGRPRERNVHILDHRLGMKADHALELLRDARAAIPAHDLGVGARAQASATIDAAHEGILSEDVLRAPEPAGVPAPDVAVD